MTRTQRFEFASIRPGVLAALAIAILIPIAIVVYALVGTGGSSSTAKTPPSRSASRPAHKATAMTHTPTQSALYKAVVGVNSSMFAQGLMPPSACKAMSMTMVTCTQPVQAINFVTFRTFPSLKALYAAYVSRVTALSGGQSFRSNYGNCTEVLTSGERAWNHNESHPITYPFNLFPAGKVTDDEAAGRIYCTFFNDQLHLVWTQDDGHLLAELSGAPHYDAYVWWRQVHHEIVLAGSPSMQSMPAGNQ